MNPERPSIYDPPHAWETYLTKLKALDHDDDAVAEAESALTEVRREVPF